MTNAEALAFYHSAPKPPIKHYRIEPQGRGEWCVTGNRTDGSGNWEPVRRFTCYPAMLRWLAARSRP